MYTQCRGMKFHFLFLYNCQILFKYCLTLITFGKNIPEEISNETIYLLLITPVLYHDVAVAT